MVKIFGVVQYQHVDVETYQVKWYKGPKPWDFMESIVKRFRTN
jgi:hypothetical protein